MQRIIFLSVLFVKSSHGVLEHYQSTTTVYQSIAFLFQNNPQTLISLCMILNSKLGLHAHKIWLSKHLLFQNISRGNPMKLNSFIILLIFPTLNICGGDSDDDCYSPVQCGKFTIGYPFWVQDGSRRKCCGSPDFMLVCPKTSDIDQHPVLSLDGNNTLYKVLDIDNDTTVIKLLAIDEEGCIFKNKTGDGDHNPPAYAASFENVLLYHQCKNMSMLGSLELTACSMDDQSPTNATYYYWENATNDDDDFKHIKENCNSSVDFSLIKLNYTNIYAYEATLGSSTINKSGNHLKLILSIAIPVTLFILIALGVGLFYLRRHKFHSQAQWSRSISYNHIRSDLEVGSSFFGIPVFSYIELQEATHNFDPDRILGDGGFGIVYHGKLRDGREVAVKRLYERNYKRVGQFMNEVEILTKLKHPNLVTLYGCTSRHSRELLLVYEYIPNGTVADHLHGDLSESSSLTWNIRMKIAIQTADALSYLHASEFVHRDVKTNNILLDNHFTVKVADFGLSRLFPLDVTHISTAPQGTPGYLDPEYRKYYQVTCKSDVYSFGVVLVELISSLPAVDISRDESDINLSTYAMNKIREGAVDELVDKNLGFDSDFKVKRMVSLVAELAFQCLQQEKEIRPSMEEVLKALKIIDSMDYEALEAEETNRGFQISKQASGVVESEVKQTSRNYQYQNSSPKSVIVGWASSMRSTFSNSGSG